MRKGVKDGLITPVFCGSAVNQQALDMLLYNMHKLLPSPEHNSVLAEDANGEPVELTCAESEPTAAYVFKTVADPFVGQAELSARRQRQDHRRRFSRQRPHR